MARTLTDLDSLVREEHPDPASLLGVHPDGAGAPRLTVFRPGATSVVALIGDDTRPLEMVHPAGIFQSPFPAGAKAYRLRVTYGDGRTAEIADPYAFPPLLGDLDLHLLGEGTQLRSYDLLGAHVRTVEGVTGVHFAVWAPHARWVGVIGDFNGWDSRMHPMRRRGAGGIWELFIPGLGDGAHYKYHIRSQVNEYVVDKSDPYGFWAELRPNTASIVTALGGYNWGDDDWVARRAGTNLLTQPVNIYEVHLGSWRRAPDGSFLNYRELAHELVAYVQEMGFSHIELMPITEHPTDVSWGYQTTGYYAPTSRFGSPQDLMYFVDYCHQHGIGVFMDWVPSHFAKEGHGLGFFDGTHLYEYADPRKGEHFDWGTYVFDYGRGEVLGFLLANALFWLDVYHFDGFRVDAVKSMLYLDHARPAGQWVPNIHGGNEHLEAVAFLRRMNELVHGRFPGVVTMAEESSTWPMVSRPVYLGGLGFTMKWNMGWMHDTLEYFKYDAVFRRYHHNQITFSIMYQYTENYVLPLSHDEVVHGKSPLVYKAPGDEWQKFASLRLMLGYMWAHPGKKLLFMGGEFAQTTEWNFASQLRWDLLQYPAHQGARDWMRALNALYREHPALWELDSEPDGFRWIDCSDVDQSILIMLRRGRPDPAALAVLEAAPHHVQAPPSAEQVPDHASSGDAVEAAARAAAQTAIDRTRPFVIVSLNFTPVVRQGYRVGVPRAGVYREALNSDDRAYGGSGVVNEGMFVAEPVPWQGFEHSLLCTLPPLGASVFLLAE